MLISFFKMTKSGQIKFMIIQTLDFSMQTFMKAVRNKL